jgi:hypothetical protein
MSLIRHIGTFGTLLFAVGVTLGLVAAVYAQSVKITAIESRLQVIEGTDAQLPGQVSLHQWPIVARPPAAADRGRDRSA